MNLSAGIHGFRNQYMMRFLRVIFLHGGIKMIKKNGEDKRSEKKNKRKIVSPLDGGCQRTFCLEWYIEGLL